MDGTAIAAPPAMDGARESRLVKSTDGGAAAGGEREIPPAPNPNKRPKMTSARRPTIFDLPDALLLQIAGHLSVTSKALLAVALTASSESLRKRNFDIQPSEATRIILMNDDFFSYPNDPGYSYVCLGEAAEKDLLARLSDEDVGGVLSCVKAIYGPIKSVSLARCVGISGRGLEPLRGSRSLERLYLNLANGDENPDVSPPPKFAVEAVVPLLESALVSKASSLTYFDLPKIWQREQSPMLVRFLEKFSSLMDSREFTCTVSREGGVCGRACRGTRERPWVGMSGENFGEFAFTCYGCDRHFCADCADESFPKVICQKCEAKCCKECVDTLLCRQCGETSCHECTYIDACDICSSALCSDCFWMTPCSYCFSKHCIDCMIHYECEYPGCYESYCADCADEDGSDAAKECLDCGGTYCGDHMLVKHIARGADAFCIDCNDRAASNLAWRNKRFEEWVRAMESKYVSEGHKKLCSESGSFSDLLKEREWLRQRCAAVGDKLLLKQKGYEKFDTKVEEFETVRGEYMAFE